MKNLVSQTSNFHRQDIEPAKDVFQGVAGTVRQLVTRQ